MERSRLQENDPTAGGAANLPGVLLDGGLAAVEGLCKRHFELLRVVARVPDHLGTDVKVILTPPCIFCMENHR